MRDKRKVLLVEDELLVRYGLKSVVDWEKLGMEICGDVSNGREALEIYERFHPDIIITDIKMPIMDGLELIKIIREKDKKTRIIILTCFEEFNYLLEALRLGVSDYVLKLQMNPKQMEALLEKMNKEMDECDGKDENRPYADENVMKDNLFKEYSIYKKISVEEFRNQLKEMDVEIEEKNIILCKGIIRKYEKQQANFEDFDGTLIHFIVMNIGKEIISHYGTGELIREREGKYLLFLNWKEDSCDLDYLLNEISRTISTYMGFEIGWGVSQMYQSWECLPRMYQECCDAAWLNEIGSDVITKFDEKQDETYKDIDDNSMKQLSVEIYNALDYMNSHLCEKLTLNQVSAHIGLSSHYFSSLFKNEMNVGFTEYILNKRVEKAKELFETTDMRISEVAEAVGFIDESYFSRIFKKITGKTPGAFRKRRLT